MGSNRYFNDQWTAARKGNSICYLQIKLMISKCHWNTTVLFLLVNQRYCENFEYLLFLLCAFC